MEAYFGKFFYSKKFLKHKNKKGKLYYLKFNQLILTCLSIYIKCYLNLMQKGFKDF